MLLAGAFRCPVDEQRHRGGQVERTDVQNGFATRSKWHLAGRDEPHPGRTGEQDAQDVSNSADDVLAAVEDDQSVNVLEPIN